MKKLLTCLAIILALAFAVPAMADSFTDGDGGTLAEADWASNGTHSYYIEFIWTDTTGDGVSNQTIAVPSTLKDFWIYSLEQDSGATTPDADYDVTITKKTSGTDVFQGGCEGLDGTDTTADPCYPASGYVQTGGEDLYFTAANQGTAGAICTYKLWLVK